MPRGSGSTRGWRGRGNRFVADRNLRRAVFLDRDGTICEEMGYLNHISRLRIFPFALKFEAVESVSATGMSHTVSRQGER